MKPKKLLPPAMAVVIVFSMCMTCVTAYAEDGGCAVCGTDDTQSMPAARLRDTPVRLDIKDGSITVTSTGYKQGDANQETAYTGSYAVMQSGGGTANRIIIESGNINMSIVGLNMEAANAPAIRVENSAALNLTLSGENTLKGGTGYAAISVAPGIWDGDTESYTPGTPGRLEISGEGSLSAAGGDAAGSGKFGGGAGIGGDGYGAGNTEGGDFGVVEIAGGTVTAKGGGAVSINYGAGAGIGGGGGDSAWAYAGTVIISGGNVSATGGGDYNDFCAAAAIGSGSADANNPTSGTDIRITGGVIKAYGGTDAAAIGGSTNGDSGTITITGGDITAVGGAEGTQWPYGGAGIGGGDNGGGNMIAIGGTAKVTATGGGAAAGIGGGNGGYVEQIALEGQAEVTAVGGRVGGAGIGGGNNASYATGPVAARITLNTQGTVAAYGGNLSQAIGFGAFPLSNKSYSIAVGENAGPVWMFNSDQRQSAVNGINVDNTVDPNALSLNNHVVFWHNGTDDASSGSAYFWDGTGTPENSVYTWKAENGRLTIEKGGTEVVSFQYDPALHDASDNWAAVYQNAPDTPDIPDTPNAPDIQQGNLTVSKSVSGSEGDTGKEFHFTVTLGDSSISGTYGDVTFTGGVASFTLKHGEEKTIVGLPAGTSYVVTEAEANQDGYITNSINAEGVVKAGESVAVTFTSQKDTEPKTPDQPDKPNGPGAVPKTGDENDPAVWAALYGLSLLCLTGTLAACNKKRYRPKHR